jgi:hypothetical protein
MICERWIETEMEGSGYDLDLGAFATESCKISQLAN